MSTVSNETANEEDVYFNFINSLKSDVTKKTYEGEIKKFMEFSDVEKFSRSLVYHRTTETDCKIFDITKRKGIII